MEVGLADKSHRCSDQKRIQEWYRQLQQADEGTKLPG